MPSLGSARYLILVVSTLVVGSLVVFGFFLNSRFGGRVPRLPAQASGNLRLSDVLNVTTEASPAPSPSSKHCMSDVCNRSSKSRGCCCSVPAPAPGAALHKPDLSVVPKESDIVSQYANAGIKSGGSWSPTGCDSEQLMALVIPFRQREENLLLFLNYIHGYLQKQKLAYTLFVVDQVDKLPFNRAMLFNVGVLEALKDRNYSCFVFHDVDHIPVDPMLSYWCDSQPIHMAARVDKWNFGLAYFSFAGGVTKQSTAQLFRTNGFATVFWGWGGEDDDLGVRWRSSGYKLTRPADKQGNYATMSRHHTRGSSPDFDRMAALRTSKARMPVDGLNSTRYTLVAKDRAPLYTRLRVELKKDMNFEYLYKKKGK